MSAEDTLRASALVRDRLLIVPPRWCSRAIGLHGELTLDAAARAQDLVDAAELLDRWERGGAR